MWLFSDKVEEKARAASFGNVRANCQEEVGRPTIRLPSPHMMKFCQW